MVRVHFEEREPRDYDANDIDIGPSGTVTLRRVTVKYETDPANVRERRVVVSNPQFLAAWSITAGWTCVENLDPAGEVHQPEHQEALP
jgi:hypothetical protein